MVTIYDVAREADVSIATVSRVLNKKGKYSSEVERRVLEAAEKLNYAVNVNAKTLKTGIRNIIGISLPLYYIEAYPEFFKTIALESIARDFYPEILIDCPIEECNNLLKSGKFDGMIIIDPDKNDMAIHNIARSDYRTVFIGCDIEREDINVIEIDYFQAGYLGTKELLKAGHTDISLVFDKNRNTVTEEIKRGYLFAHDEYGVPYNEDYILKNHSGNINNHMKEEEIIRVLSSVSSVLAIDLDSGLKILSLLKKSKKEIPVDISFVICGEKSYSLYIYPEPTAVLIPAVQAASLAVDILLNSILLGDDVVKRIKLMIQLKKGRTVLKRLTKK